MSKIDTQIRHTTQPTDNIFADLGLEDAGNLKKEADALINAKLALTKVVADWVQENHFKQEEAAEILGVSRPRLSNAINAKISKFTLDALITMVSKTGHSVKISITN